jgi:cardiolipin synthase
MSAVYTKQNAQFTTQNKLQIISGGKPYFDLLLSLIHAAKESIHLQTYILNDDDTGHLIIDALKLAAKRNVAVYLLVDGYASQSISTQFIKELKLAGIQFRYFEPLFKTTRFYFGRRMHHKIFVVDAQYAVVGGINIANRYNDIPTQPAWLDFALYAHGEIAKQLCVLCWKTWNNFPLHMGITPCEEKLQKFNFTENESMQVRIRRNDWVRQKNEISSTYIQMFRNAQSHITILCSYFLPGRIIRRLLQNAAKRGVKIRVITASQSDIAMAKNAERWMYDWLLRNDIELYEYQPTILHAKVAVCDGQWFTIGSYNVNNISAYASIELNVDVNNAALATSLDTILDNIIINDCEHISVKKHLSNKNILNQFVRWCSYRLIKVIFYMLTFYFKRIE